MEAEVTVWLCWWHPWPDKAAVIPLCSPRAMAVSSCATGNLTTWLWRKVDLGYLSWCLSRLTSYMTSVSKQEFYFALLVNFENISGASWASSGVSKAEKKRGSVINLSPVLVLVLWFQTLPRTPILVFWEGFGIIVWKGRAQCKRAARLHLWELDTSKGPFLQHSFGRFFMAGWAAFWRGLSHAINCQGILKDQTRLPFRQLKLEKVNGQVSGPCHCSIPPKIAGGCTTAAPPQLQKLAEKRGKRSLVGLSGQSLLLSVSHVTTCQGRAKQSATIPVTPRNSFPQGAPVRKTGSSLPLACLTRQSW